MSNYAPQPGYFEFPQVNGEYSSPMVYPHPSSGAFLSPPPQSPPYQFCELVYTPIPTPNGLALTPSLVPFSPMDGQHSMFSNAVPSPMPPRYGTPTARIEDMARKDEFDYLAMQNRKNVGNNFINGIPVEQWKSMTDKEREDFLKTKRRQEAFKTALCQAFQRTGECRYGMECRFAHGKEQLRLPKYNHPKYKTVLCRNYAVTGVCPYGSRCQFIHEKFSGSIPEEYVLSVEVTQAVKTKTRSSKTRDPKMVQFSEDNAQHEPKSAEKRKSKKELQANNELNHHTDMTETFSKMFDFDSKKFFSRSCKPRIEM